MFDKLIEDIKKCSYCERDFGFTPAPVVWGNKNSKIVQISQAPSRIVSETLKPFTDPSGKTLKYEWYKIGDEVFYNKDNFYIAALAHCYPGKDKNGGDKNPPKCCFERWIKKELELIENDIYIIIGAKAAKVFFPQENFEDLVFKNNLYNNKLTMVLPHPSPLNKKWIKDHPDFVNIRLKEIRTIIDEVLK